MDSSIPDDAEEITPHDTNPFNLCRAIYVGGAGHLRVQMKSGKIVTLNNVPAGTRISGGFARVFATSTTATLLVAFR
ncbi:hypothetical protein UFOVP736_14 [uncultured Caudovirales phage]|uniref:Uncharacterized protein n=1 Tax=uncultured Caudovirales phage TaxID=2100421 RepID=A0A6J7X3I3_9CAUD|nr:hypothetical protein UFOVP705_67 [uncultured Caudovirales phage]CAB5223850.1 hypothetical protein UFOVP736_14 [uncultured Caudovirales phage]